MEGQRGRERGEGWTEGGREGGGRPAADGCDFIGAIVRPGTRGRAGRIKISKSFLFSIPLLLENENILISTLFTNFNLHWRPAPFRDQNVHLS